MAQTANNSIVTKQILAYYDEKIKDYIEDAVEDGASTSFKAVSYANDTLSFYKTTDKSDTPVTINLPEEMFLDQAHTVFVNSFVWSEETYPGSTNPNLDGKPVLVLAVKGETSAIAYSFVNLENLIDVYTGGETDSAKVTVTGSVVTTDVKVSSKSGNIISVDSENKGLYAEHQDISGKIDKVVGATSGNFATLDSDGAIVDSGVKPDDYVLKTTFTGVEELVNANTTAIATLNGDKDTPNSVDNKIETYKNSIVYTNNDDIDALFD